MNIYAKKVMGTTLLRDLVKGQLISKCPLVSSFGQKKSVKSFPGFLVLKYCDLLTKS